jgi:hypothetical protein
MAWTDEQKASVIKQYQDAKPTPETSTEIIKDIAEKNEQSANGVRMVLVQAGVYVKKDATATPSKTGEKGGETKTPRVGKEAAIAALKAAIEAKGASVDEDILDKLTGKAAVYFTAVLSA